MKVEHIDPRKRPYGTRSYRSPPVSESSGDEDALESYAGDPKLYVHPKILNFNDGKDKPDWPDLPDREDRNVVNNFLKAGKSGSQRESMPYALAFISAPYTSEVGDNSKVSDNSEVGEAKAKKTKADAWEAAQKPSTNTIQVPVTFFDTIDRVVDGRFSFRVQMIEHETRPDRSSIPIIQNLSLEKRIVSPPLTKKRCQSSAKILTIRSTYQKPGQYQHRTR
ncbi:hypothetical protein FVER53590_25776 [Fusarium verticillioides]|nr:hypothetical protein FVER53590_25776 [Fusarium verticillioides]